MVATVRRIDADLGRSRSDQRSAATSPRRTPVCPMNAHAGNISGSSRSAHDRNSVSWSIVQTVISPLAYLICLSVGGLALLMLVGLAGIILLTVAVSRAHDSSSLLVCT